MILYRKAILIVHGFVGSTKDQEPLFYELNHLMKFDVYNFLLPGHDEVKYDVKYTDWLDCAKEKMDKLISYGYKDIYVIGHSMGGVIASYLASVYPDYVKKLVLLAPAFDYLSTDKNKVMKVINSGGKVLKDYDLKAIIARTFKATPRMLKEFIKLVDVNKDVIYKVDTNLLLMHGNDDAIVPIESSKDIFNKLTIKNKTFYELDKVNHDIFNSSKTSLINKTIKEYLLKKINIKNETSKI